MEELKAFLNSYDDSMENYEYIEDLDFAGAQQQRRSILHEVYGTEVDLYLVLLAGNGTLTIQI